MNEAITSHCILCCGGIHWIACPTGGWWKHDVHPRDDHDAVSELEVVEDMGDDGYWITVGVREGRSAGE